MAEPNELLAVSSCSDGSVSATADLHLELLHRASLDRNLERHHLVEHTAEGPEVRAVAVELATPNLGGHVDWSTNLGLGKIHSW